MWQEVLRILIILAIFGAAAAILYCCVVFR
jgi:hypothetical protein